MAAVRLPELGFRGVTHREQIIQRTRGRGQPAGQGADFALYTWWAFLIYAFSLVLPQIGHARAQCHYSGFWLLSTLSRRSFGASCRRPAPFAGDWLLGLSWLANPAIWAGMVFLLMGRARWAAWSGRLSLLLAACALRPNMVCQYIWVASMVYVVYVALCVPDDMPTSNPNPARPPLPKLRRSFYPAVAIPVLFGLLLLLLDQRDYIKLSHDGSW